MQIIGFNLKKIFIEKKDKFLKKIEIKQNINIESISQDKIELSEREILKVDFSFNIDYNPDFATLNIKGTILLLPKKEEFKKIIESWKEKNLSDEFRIPIFNFIMNKCNIKAFQLEDELNIPLHLQNLVPKISPKNK